MNPQALNPVPLFLKLVACDSPSYGERAVCDFLRTEFDALGLPYYEDKAGERLGGNCGNLYVTIPGRDPSLPALLFSAHMDTVEPSCGKTAVCHPDGRITSDGTTVLGADDFAGIAAILTALRAVLREGQPAQTIELLFTVAEEAYGDGVQLVEYDRLSAKQAFVFDLTGEIGHAANQAPTILSFTADFCGRAAHAGFAPEKGIHAIRAAALGISRVPCGRVDGATVNIGTIEGGTGINTVPEKCTVRGEIRSFSDERATACLEEITEVLQQAADEVGATLTCSHIRHIIAYHVSEQSAVAQHFVQACAQIGVPATFAPTYGGSDNNWLVRHGIDGLVVACGMVRPHTLGEYTTEDALRKATALAYALMGGKEMLL